MDEKDCMHLSFTFPLYICRLITMLAHSTMAEAYLHIVLVEIVPVARTVSNAASASSVSVPSAGSAGTSALLQAAEGLDPPTAREGMICCGCCILYDALHMIKSTL